MRKLLKKVIAVFLAATIALAPIAVSAEESSEHLQATRQLAETQAAALMEALSVAGLTIALVDIDNDFTWLYTPGYADAANQTPVTEQTLFNIASTAKVFTAVAIMQLVEEGILDLDEPIVTYLPEFSVLPNPVHGGNYRNITARMLLAHVSGMHEFHGDTIFTFDGKDRDFKNRLLPLLANLHMQNEELNRITYNNTAYALLGILVARLTGSENYFDGFESYVQQNIFAPAGMASSSFDVNDGNRANIALAHLDATTPIGAYQYASASSVGGMVSNAYDMARFMHIMLSGGGDILLPETIEAMRQPQDFGIPFPNDMPNTPMGLGLMHVIHGDGVATTGHGGNLLHHTEFLLDFNNGIGVFVSGNSIAAAGVVTPLANLILRAAVEEKTGSPLPATASTNLTPLTDVSRITGWYASLTLGSAVEVTQCEDDLLHILGIAGLPELTLTQATDGSFDSAVGSIWFHEVEGIVFMHLGGQTAPMLVAERLELSNSSEGIAPWLGEYHYILPNGEVATTVVIGVNEQGFAYSRQGNTINFMNQIDDNTFHYPSRIREFGSVTRFSMEGDTAVIQYSGHRLVRLSLLDGVDDADVINDIDEPADPTGLYDDTDEPADLYDGTDGPAEPTPTQLRFVIGRTEFTHNGTTHQIENAPFLDSEYRRTMIPLDVIAKVFGAEVTWTEETQTATITHGGISLTVSAVEPLPHNMGMAHVVGECIFIPLRYIAYAFGVQVSWDGANQAVYVYVTDAA